MTWVDLLPKPRPRPEPAGPFADSPIEWDVFVSYRSANRHWAMALYDALSQAGFRVFLDQFVLRPGLDLEESLDENLSRSASGVLVLSKDVATSEWVRNERRKMQALKNQRAATSLPFHFVIARIDETPLPFSAQGEIYADFTRSYEDGPRGAELVRLTHGLVGARLSEDAVRTLHKHDQEVSDLLLAIDAAARNEDYPLLVQRAKSGQAADEPVVAIAAAQALVSGGQNEAALEVLAPARQRFPRSIRLQQLEGLALRRLGRIREAQDVLARLYVAGHRDPETMGIYAATWMERYKASQDRAHLERSRALYFDAFKLSPKDEYVGINAAAKTALLGELTQARELAEQVRALVDRHADASDFYKSLSLAEALVILGRYDEAATLYRDVRVRHNRPGDLTTTREQLNALLEALQVPGEAADALRGALGMS